MSLKRSVLLLTFVAAVGALVAAAGGSASPTRWASTDAVRCTVNGTARADVLRGTIRADVICGRGGNDTIRGLRGNDRLDGGPGRDTIVGGLGNDNMIGGAGNDVFSAGNEGRDRITGGPGRDRATFDSSDRVVGVEIRRPIRRPAALPALPAEVRSRGRWIIGVKCDAPPFGYIDVRGNNAGFDIDVARWFSRYAFGNAGRVNFECAPTASREPLITTGRVDLVISTFTYTSDRDTRIDFSRPYYRATGRLLVRGGSPIRSLNDIRGRRIATTDGSIYHRWMARCFPTAEVVTTDGVTSSVLRLNQGRADAVMWDDVVLAPIAAADRNTQLTNDAFLEAPYGIGMRQGYTAMKRWVDSRLGLMKANDLFLPILRNHFADRFVTSFSRNILRPNQDFQYRSANLPSIDTVCP
jgi:polar amino acid transport system substrate-binding protein